MNGTEKSIVKIVAKTAPWLAPLPSAYFVARSGMVHLDLPLPMAVVAAVIIETLGLATVHTALWALDWNRTKRKSDPRAPWELAIALSSVYWVATLGLVVLLEVQPGLAVYAPAIFPALAIVGTVNLVMISRQEWRELEVAQQKAEARQKRQEKKQQAPEESVASVEETPAGWQQFLEAYPDMLAMSGREIGEIANVSVRTGNYWKQQVRDNGKVDQEGHRALATGAGTPRAGR